jgi:two-component system, cell cycle sensor histidine kinase and response regulator CckA
MMTLPRSRLLIVEDEAIVAMDLQQRLERLGHDVVGTAATGEAAIQRAEEARPDVTLMDIRLKGKMDGVTAAAEIDRRFDSPVVFLTAHSDAKTVQRATATEPFGYILKPVDDRELEIAIAVARYRHQAERRVKQMERWLATTLTSIGDGVISLDLNGRVTFINAVAQRLTGWDLATAMNRHVQEVMPLINEDDLTEVENPVRQVLSEGVVLGLSARTAMVRRSGERIPIDDSAAPVRDEHGNIIGVVLVFRDATERRRLADEMHQSKKLEAVGRLAGGVAHEFNNLMTVVLGCSELVLNDHRLDAELREAVVDIRSAGDRAAVLTRQLLTFGRKQPIRPQVLDLNGVIADIAGMLDRLLGDHVSLKANLSARPAMITADRNQIEQLVINLAANGRDAMPAGGTLTIATNRDSSTVLLIVSDTGVGMSAEVKDHLFEPFFTTKDPGKGTGLGLAAVYGTVMLANGRIDVDSSAGSGTTFRIQFPASETVAPSTSVDAPLPPPFTAAGETILVVDDDQLVRELVAKILTRSGFVVLEADGAERALQVANAHRGNLHLVVADVVMRSGSGVEVARRLAAARPGMKALLMSGYAERSLIPLKSGGVDARFIQKPFVPAELLARVGELLAATDPAGRH